MKTMHYSALAPAPANYSPWRRRFRRWALGLSLLTASTAAWTSGASAQNFTVQGAKILDPTGQEFVPKGANIGLWGNQASAAVANRVKNVWKFNTVRIYTRLAGDEKNYPSNEFLDGYVNQYASTANGPKTVVIFECHDFSGGYYSNTSTPSLTDLRNFWKRAAARYKDNPYVWFNIMNEPGPGGNVSPEWYTMHKTVVNDIRAEGAKNVIVVDGNGFGSEDGNGLTKANPILDNTSAFLTYGPQLLQDDPQHNIVFDLHCYVDWRHGADKLYNFVDRVHAKNLALVVGEYAAHTGSSQGERSAAGSAQAVLEVARARKVGALVWHYVSGDRNSLTTGAYGGAGGEDIDKTDGTRPTNLSWLGERVWDYTHGAPLEPARGVPLNRYAWTASSSRGSGADLAIDGSPDTEFAMGDPTGAEWYKVDLGASQSFNRVLIDTRKSASSFMRAGKVYLSDNATSDGQLIATVSGNKMAVNDLALGSTVTGRYLTIRPTEFGKNYPKATNVSWAIADLQLYAAGTHTAPQLGTVALGRAAWKGYASKRSGWNGEWEAKAFDDNVGSRYASGANAVRGAWYYVDLGTAQTFQSLLVSAGSSANNNYARKVQVFVSNDVNNWGRPVAEQVGSAITKIVFSAPQTGRYVRLVCASDIGDWWAIHDLQLYAPPTGTPPPTVFSGAYKLTVRHSGKVLEVANSSTADGATVQQWSDKAIDAQQWALQAVGTDGYYTLTNVASNKKLALDLNPATNGGYADPTADGARVFQFGTNAADNRLWKIEALADGYYKLTNKRSGKALAISGGPTATADGAPAQQQAYTGATNQQWQIVDLTTGNRQAATSAAVVSESLSAYPNPSPDGRAALRLQAREAQTATVYIRDGQGQLVSLLAVPVHTGATDFRLPSTLPTGTYYVQATIDGQPQRFTLRVQ